MNLEMMAGLINTILCINTKSSIIDRVTAEQVRYVMNQLKSLWLSTDSLHI